MIKIGITGGIGSGKSIVAHLFSLQNIPIYIADSESKELVNSSSIIREKLCNLFGQNLYSSDGLNKGLLAKYIFNDSENLQKVNAIIHPIVYDHFIDWCSKQHADIVAIESAILFESGFDQLVNIKLTVSAPLLLRIERVMERDCCNKEEILQRIDKQLSDEEKIKRADFVIYNDLKHSVIRQTIQIIDSLQ